jgi:hypothetical protein
VFCRQNRAKSKSSERRIIGSGRDNAHMKQLFVIVVGLLAALSIPQAHAQYGDGLPMSPAGSAVTGEMLERCSELGISRVQCSDASILQAGRVELAENSVEKGSGTSMITTELGQMALFIGVLSAAFGGIAGAFYLKGRARQVPA